MECSVLALSEEFEAEAAEIAKRLGLPVQPLAAYQLQLGSEGWQLKSMGDNAPGALRVDFLSGAVAHRRQFGGGLGQSLAKAVGAGSGARPRVLDLTAGLGRDAFVLASLGCNVIMVERNKIVAQLLRDGLQRALRDLAIGEIMGRMQLIEEDALQVITGWQNEAPEVIYLDPMFPHTSKTAAVKKEMNLFRPLVGADIDADALLAPAIALATHRVVVKRPRKAPFLADVKPNFSLEGKANRFDIYAKKAFKK